MQLNLLLRFKLQLNNSSLKFGIMKKNILFVLIAISTLVSSSNPGHSENRKTIKKYLSSWNETRIDTTFSINILVDYVKKVTGSGSDAVPEDDRIAVFDMDGTLACERPFSMELYFAYDLAFGRIPNCSDSVKQLQGAVLNAFNGYLPGSIVSDSIVALTTRNTRTIVNSCIPKENPEDRVLSKQFYQPMIELIHYLLVNKFQIYIVSGSSQQFIWGIVKNVETLNQLPPSHIIGSLQKYKTITHLKGKGPEFYIDSENFLSNVSSGKAINIYNRIGKKPILAFGNTVNDFDMFSLTSSNTKHPTLCVLINHDSDSMEEAYPAYKTSYKVCENWNQEPYCSQNWSFDIFKEIMNKQGWYIANMSECFKYNSVFIK